MLVACETVNDGSVVDVAANAFRGDTTSTPIVVTVKIAILRNARAMVLLADFFDVLAGVRM